MTYFKNQNSIFELKSNEVLKILTSEAFGCSEAADDDKCNENEQLIHLQLTGTIKNKNYKKAYM